MPAVDLNAVLVAIRIASYGHNMEITSTCPSCETASDYTIDLRQILDSVSSPDFSTPMVHGDLTFWFRPMDYKAQTETGKLQFEQQRSIVNIQESDLPEETKVSELNKVLSKITSLTIDALKYSIQSIQTPQALVTEIEFINEFLTNCDRKLFIKIRDHIIKLREQSEFKPIILDQSSFFGSAS
jgi:hypothetical protein